MYEIKQNVYYSDIREDKRVRFYQIANYFQNCSSRQSEALDIGLDYLEKEHHAWLLSSWQIVVERFPQYEEELTIRTWPFEFKGIYGYRNFDILDANGNEIVKAYSIWVYYDFEIRRPIKPSEHEMNLYVREKKIDMDYAPRKIGLTGEFEEQAHIVIQRHQIDVYHHMNNARYVEIAEDYLPDTFVANQVRVDYRKETRCGTELVPQRQVVEDRCVIALYDVDDVLHAIIEFSKV